MEPMGLILVAAGLFSLCGAFFNWDFFMNARKARLVVALLGRTGARFFYGTVGTVGVMAGLAATFGLIGLR
jgi:hypothetical protein